MIRSSARRRLAAIASLLVACAVAVPLPVAAARSAEKPTVAVEFPEADSLEGNYLAAIVAGSARDTGAAAVYFREALRDDPRNPELVERAFVAFLADGDMREAFRAAQQIIKREPNNGLARLALGVKALEAKQYATARRELVRGGRGYANDITATLLTAWAWAGSGNLKRALETVDRLKGESSYNVFRDYHAGLIAAMRGNPKEAERRLGASYNAERTTLRVVDAYGRLEAAQGRKDNAIAAYEAFEKLMPRHPVVRAALKDLKAGKDMKPLVVTPQQGAAEVLYGLGAAGNSQGDEVAAMIYLRLALFLNPDHDLAKITLGDILERLKQYEQAIEVYKSLPSDSPLKAHGEVQIALSLDALDKTDEAIAYLQADVARNPGDIEGLTALGSILQKRKRFAESAEVYSKAIAQIGTPELANWPLFYSRGIGYERSKQWPKAEADFKKALELAPESIGRDRALILNYLAYSWVDQGLNIDEAFQMLRRAVELRPRDGYIVDSLGWAYYRLGRYDDAVRELEKAVDLRPADPTINDHLGDAYWKVGRKLEAKFQWNHARDLDPEPEDLVKIKKKIEQGLPDNDKPAAAEVPKTEKNGG
ncbi:tetratricopeptide repeat protein [Chelatococcus asaccharovorans]|uniref:tetratricopeptide repeat protein n=1 Tax=Chelatococcus asaccharovorans TaxID=28210 RepID=UPI001FE24169|nr:tetratricopeptide repeat protein [Chelatococcus asaccharovorans]CAH1669629.1 Flp pilus assembly protein TadD [Chelatococcus asaccharovorans]CAH1678914.1 Flp pilus assembly protein TadD [Chelatococcus asaccharovorans]